MKLSMPAGRPMPNQVIAWNMAYFRKSAKMTQEQLGEWLGWTNVAVSAAERSWDGKRVRKFDADEITAIAEVLDVPVAALFLPPPCAQGRSADALVTYLEGELEKARTIDVSISCPTCADKPPAGFTCDACGKSGTRAAS